MGGGGWRPDSWLPSFTSAEGRRLQFDFSAESAQRLDALVELTGASSRAEVVRRALQLFDQVVQTQMAGGAVRLVHADRTEERVVFL